MEFKKENLLADYRQTTESIVKTFFKGVAFGVVFN